ncbi:hypothetical protein ASD04_11875 [Devosia sp. Root436]|uniref:hypothetical protein n=1 Tax=Devosia sp. Root436 TaxID=1736537 RepID=UPI0006FC0E58|nr:hypothetical protein [Devosia sp. Root436]KQX38299.1 hypothetical protein ASD04_11875 [Devosia sp. Root436]
MIRPFAVFAVLALGLGAATAQDATPAPAQAPEIVIDPAASLNTTPKQANMLTGFYATQAVIEICALAIEPDIATGMAADRARLETALGMDATMAAGAFAQVKADVEKTSPDCADGSADRAGVDAVTAIYAALPPPAAEAPSPAAGTVTTDAPATPAQ